MAFKRALVVDDSKTARQSLARLLADYEIEVAFAESGEAALSFLHHELVDMIFMDHTMPGMDGLEAVSAIKSNPRTATIPVMMYTTKEGEVYVSQARALGAVGVLPKQFNPNVLFDMLQKLGLVTDRRNPDAPAAEEAPRRRISDLTDDAEQEYERRAVGVSVQTLVTRILEEQNLKLRSEILSSHRRFAQQVAAEILGERTQEQPMAGPGPSGGVRARMLAGVAAMLALAVGVLGAASWNLQHQLGAARLEIARMNTASRNEIELLAGRTDGLSSALRESATTAQTTRRAAVDALTWALNGNALVPFDEPPFGDMAANKVEELLTRLDSLGFAGTVTMTATLAPFCLDRDPSGQLQLAAAAAPVDDCPLVGHPLAGSGSMAAWQSVSFAAAADTAGQHPDIRLRLARRELGAAELPANLDSAGAWNRQAARLNRLTFDLEPAPSGLTVAGRP